MNKTETIKKVNEMKAAISKEEWETLIRHGRTAVSMETEISIEGNKNNLDSIKNCPLMGKLLKHELASVRGTAQNIINKAKAAYSEGWAGDGVYLID